MKNLKLFFAALFVALSPVFLQAQAAQGTQDRSDTARAQEQLERDTRALSHMQNLQARILEAHEIGDLPSVKAIKGDILEAMNQVIEQTGSQNETIVARQSEILQELQAHVFVMDSKAQEKLNLVEEFIQLMNR